MTELVTELATERLVLQALGSEHVAGYADLATAEDARREIAAAELHWREHAFGPWAVLDRATGAFVGVSELHLAGPGVSGIDPGEIEAGWTIHADSQGRGLATEAMAAALADVWTRAAAAHVVAYIRPENGPSHRVAQKLGFTVRGPGLTRSGEPMSVYELRAPSLSSARLRLTPLALRDLDDYAALRGDMRMRVHSRSGLPIPRPEARMELLASCASWRENGFGNWRIGDRDGSFVGVVVSVPSTGSPPGSELGWLVLPEAWGRGIATEAAALALEDLVRRAGIRKVVANLDSANVASRRVAEKLGLRLRDRGPGSRGGIVESYELPPSDR